MLNLASNVKYDTVRFNKKFLDSVLHKHYIEVTMEYFVQLYHKRYIWNPSQIMF